MRLTRRRLTAAIITGLTLAGTVITGAQAASVSGTEPVPPGCAPTQPGGGDWPQYGRDLADTRAQADEQTIDATKAATLTKAWVFPVTANGGSGQLNSTPIVADGCVFAGTSDGDVIAVNADTGKQVWRTRYALASGKTAGLGGLIVGATVVRHGRVFALINEQADGSGNGPYAVALDEATGQEAWRSRPFHTYTGDYTNATPAVLPLPTPFGDLHEVVFAGWSPAEGDSNGQGGFVLLDAITGKTLVTTETIPKVDQAQGYAGGGIWSAPAYDQSTGFAYIGASNPYSKTKEHKYTNALLKIDLRPGTSFGQIVGSYKGNVDQYDRTLQTLSQQPACEASDQLNGVWTFDDPVCGQLDLDFGAAPNLFRDKSGNLLIGGLQKAGVFHAAHADTMQPAWHTIVGAPCVACNAASTAAGPGGVYGVATPGGVAFGLDRSDGTAQWHAPVAGVLHYESISTANGLVYTFDTEGFLDVFDAATGAPVNKIAMSADTGAPGTSLTSAGVSIARHTVFAAVTDGTANNGNGNGYLVAYRPAA